MAKFRNISSDARYVLFGTPSRLVQPDDVIDVADDAVENYETQTEIWQVVSDSPAKKPASVVAPVEEVV